MNENLQVIHFFICCGSKRILFYSCSLGNYVSLHGRFYCLPHYKQLLQSKGSFENGLGQNPPTRSAAPLPTDEKPVIRYSVSGLNSLEKAHIGATTECDESRLQSHKIAVVWPPQDDPPKKAFQIEEDIQLTKPQWPPPHNSPKSPKHQHRKAVPRSILWRSSAQQQFGKVKIKKKSTKKEDALGKTTRRKCGNRGSWRWLKKERKVEIWEESCCVYA